MREIICNDKFKTKTQESWFIFVHTFETLHVLSGNLLSPANAGAPVLSGKCQAGHVEPDQAAVPHL